MTIGIAVLMSDSIILVADGRTRRFDIPEQPIISDDENKIVLIGQSFAAVTCGIREVTDDAVKTIDYNWQPSHTLEEVLELVGFSLEEAWKFHAPHFPPGLDLNDPHLHGTLLIGGLIGGTEFIGSAAHNHLGRRPTKAVTVSDSLQFMIASIEQEIAGDYFEERLVEKFRTLDTSVGDERRLRLMIDAAAETVRFMQTKDSSIGGTIRYLILQRGAPPDTGIYEFSSQHHPPGNNVT